jgi:cobalt-zinc-cadmium resistance protein CzcA
LSERRTLLDWTLRPALRTLPGVADVNVLGGEAASFAVVPDRARLSAAGLSFADVVTASAATTATTARAAWTRENTLIVRAEGAIRSADDLSPSCCAPPRPARLPCAWATWPPCAWRG